MIMFDLRTQCAWHGLAFQSKLEFVNESVYTLLGNLYESSDRFYHNKNHINKCFEVREQFTDLITCPEEVILAISFHDAIYNTHDNKNEENSALLFEVIAGNKFSKYQLTRVQRMILLTKHQYPSEAKTIDEKIVLDIDLSSLAADSRTFNTDTDNIRKEYSWVPEKIFWENRIKFLSGLLANDKIYHSDKGIELFEVKARENIKQSIEAGNILINNLNLIEESNEKQKDQGDQGS